MEESDHTLTDDKDLTNLVLLVIELRIALARERGGGSPISTKEYLDLDQRAKDAQYGLELP